MPDAQKYTNNLANNHVLITGGSSGLGYGLAEALLEHDAHVYISSSKRASEAVSRLQQSYPSKKDRIHGFVCDLGNADTLEANIETLFQDVAKVVSRSGGKLDHVVHTAGDPLAMMTVDEFTMAKVQKAAVVRFWAPLFIAKVMRNYLNPGPHSSFTITTGAISQKPIPKWTVVASYAGGLHAMTRNLAVDLKPIRVNLISPGAVDTELWGEERENVVKTGATRTLTGKIGTVEDVVEAYLYLMKDKNATGSCVSTNSGGILL